MKNKDKKLLVRLARCEKIIELIALDYPVFITSIKPYRLTINVNDYFGPAADCEVVEWKEIDDVHKGFMENGIEFAYEWVAKKRGIHNISWRDK